MKNFTYYNPTKIVFGRGTIPGLSKLIPESARIMLLAGGGSIRRTGVYDQVTTALGKRIVTELWGILPNPEYEICMEAVSRARAHGIDFLLSVGGGSVLDATKFVAAALPYQGSDPWDFMEDRSRVTSAVPLGAVLTLPATGSESNGNAVISRQSLGQKLAFSSSRVQPRFAVLDPETSFHLDARQTGNGVVDAFVHVLEQHLTYDVNSPLQDRQAEAILLTLIEEGPKVLSDPGNYDVRANIMWCATNALNNLINCGVVQDWATHMIGHELTVLHGLDHARTLAVVMPALLRHQKAQKLEKLAQYARRVWALSGPSEQIVPEAIDRTEVFFRSMGVRTRLSDYGLTFEDCRIAASRIEERVGKIGERGDIGAAEIETILKSAE